MNKLLSLFAVLLIVVACNSNTKTISTSEEEKPKQVESPLHVEDIEKEKAGAETEQPIIHSQIENSSPPPPPPPPAPKREVVNLMYDRSVAPIHHHRMFPQPNTESYAEINENTFQDVLKSPYSTFSIDVDRASYANMRRFINNGNLPPVDAVRIEEMINYFDYSYNQPTGRHPFSVATKLTDSPWNKGLQLAHISLQGKSIDIGDLPPSNLVFLVDVSGSMSSGDKLQLLQSGFNLLINELREQDQVSIVVYAGAAGVVLEPTKGDNKKAIRKAINDLRAGGSTAGGEGIQLAYKTAKDNLIKGGNNRVILATDGDFNVGVSSNDQLEKLIEEERKSGVFLSVLGFGMGNYKDDKMETLANKGNGNYAYIDNLLEAKKVFVSEFGGTLFTIAKDVKLQVEFNPANVAAYRLIGYENRKLNDEDFNDDKKDAGEMGSGHTVTAIYEIIPTGLKSEYLKQIDELKYQANEKKVIPTTNKKDVLTVKIRYKQPDEDVSTKFDSVLEKRDFQPFNSLDNDVQFSIAVAEFGLLLRDSSFKGAANYDHLIEVAKKAKGIDDEGYRAEFLQLSKMAQLLNQDEIVESKQ